MEIDARAHTPGRAPLAVAPPGAEYAGAAALFAGPGEMRARCRALDWAATPLGPVERWPPSLRTTAATVLAMGFPAIVLWGAELVQLYNDAYTPILGVKHPVGLGLPTRECWPEAWDVNAPIYARVAGGETVTLSEQRYRLARRGPEQPLDEVYLTLSYVPVRNEVGDVGGVLVTLIDTTAQVLGRAAAADRAAQQLELELTNQQLQDQALEREQQTEEAQTLAEELELTNAELQRASDRAARLLAVAAGLSAAATPEAVADVIFREGLAAVGADAGSLALVHTAGDMAPPGTTDTAGDAVSAGTAGTARLATVGAVAFETVRTMGYPDPLTAKYRRYPLTPGRPLSDAVLARAPRLLGSWAEWREAYPAMSTDVGAIGYAYEAFAAIPVLVGGRVLAALSASFRHPMTFDDGTRTFLATLGEQCGLALERARATDAERRAREASVFLAEASHLLAASLDYATTLRTVAEAAVPRLGDWCAVDIVLDPTTPTWPPILDRVATVHQDPEKLALGATLSARYPTDWSAEAGMAAVIRDGVPLFVPVITDAMLDAGARDAEHRALLAALQFSSILVVPLIARGRTLGALTLCHTESARRYEHADLALAQHLAARAALAVDNARLYRDAERAREAADASRAVAETANQAKTQFLANMSHELRTPLNAIGGYVQLLEMELHGPVTADQRASLGRVQTAQHRLLALINDVLNYAKLESGRIEYDVRAVDVRDVIADVVPLIEPQMAAKGLAFEVQLPDAPCVVWADRDKLGQVLVNLLANAAKFTDRRPGAASRAIARVTVDLATREPGPGAGRSDAVYVRVTDTGRGIPREKQDAIFEPFVQVRTGYARATEGTGLGLAISRDLARGMGGDLRVRSVEGEGSTFTVTLRRVVDALGNETDRRIGEERRDADEQRSGENRRGDDAPPVVDDAPTVAVMRERPMPPPSDDPQRQVAASSRAAQRHTR